MAQIGTAVAADAINKVIVAPLLQQIDDVIHLDQNRGILQAKLNRMKLLLQDICHGFQNQQRTPADSIRDCLESTPADSIRDCLESTRDAVAEAKSLIDRSQLQQRCLDCIFCKPRISRQIREWNTRFDQLLQELRTLFSIFAHAEQIGSSSAQPPAKETLQPLPEWGIVGMDIKSAETQLQTLINAETTQFRIIGVFGMAGVGKTTLLKSVYNFFKVSDAFDVVIWVTVSQDYKIWDLQGRIAEAINLDLSKTSDIDSRKMKLSASLKKKKFILILDDMWGALDMQELGVAFGTDKPGSKVVFSTRSRDLASMEAQQSIKVEPLSRDEGRALFERVAFKGGDVPEELKECAREIADECEGLPLAITVVAAAMSGKTSTDEWNTSSSLMKIADPSFPNTHPRVDKELYRKLRWSYDDLPKTPNLQNCFLYCAMYPEDQQIEVKQLVLMWIAEGFVKSKEATYSMDMDLGRSYVKILINRGLFQSVDFENKSKGNVKKPLNVWKWRRITVHDVIRDMAIYIGEKEENYLCHAGQRLKEFPPSPSQDCKRMSLHNNQIESLPKDFVCTQLVSLILTKNPFPCNVPQSFLINLVSLRVLDLSWTNIESVPTSLGQLRLLEFLSLAGTRIEELPEEICNLSKLQFLDLSFCKRLSSLPSMIGKLTQLQNLSLWRCADLVVPLEISQLASLKTLVLDIHTKTDVMALQGLSNLIELCLNIYVEFEGHEIMGTWLQMRHLWLYSSNINTLPSGLQNNMVNTLPSGMQNIKELQSLRVWSMQGFNLPNWICEFQHLERLELRYCQKVEALPPLERLPNLKFLKVCNCDMLRDLGIGSSGKAVGFPMLERLDLIDLPEMVTLSCHEGVLKEEGMLAKLRVLKIKDCPELRKLPMDMEKLPHLKALYCHRIWWENIIWEDNNMKMYFDKLFEEI